MGGDHSFYDGSGKVIKSDYNERFLKTDYRRSASSFGFPTDPRTANQIKAVSDKLSTGAKTIEVSGVTTEVLDYIPNQHLDEIHRLKKLVGADLTFHGPLVEPTGVSKQGWDENDRANAERQIWSAIDRSHRLDPQGNIIVTIHASTSLPEPETKVIEETPDGKKVVIKSIFAVDERNGQFTNVQIKEDFFSGKTDPYEELDKKNKEAWFNQLYRANYGAFNSEHILKAALGNLTQGIKDPEEAKKVEDTLINYYKTYGTPEAEKYMKDLTPESADVLRDTTNQLTQAEIYLRESYNDLRNSFNQAYEAAKRDGREDDLKKLDRFKSELQPKIKELENNPLHLRELVSEVTEGVNVLRSIKTPQLFRPLKDFAIEKSAETFSNVALQSYKKFKDSSPIISIENPPAGSGIHRAEDMKAVIEESRSRFADKAVKELNISRNEAEKQAEKLIGATWDVGHINMIRKFGYDEKQVVEETKKIAPFVKHVHLSDNFGMEHTELPMGMGNVPTKPMLEAIEGYNKQVKKIVETGGWFQHFKVTPFRETLEAFGSPVYGMHMSPYWNQAAAASGAYFGGFGYNPEQHHSMYGSGFSMLPVELGGQLSGKNRLSGAPIE